VNKVDPDSVGVHPDWRKALAVIIVAEWLEEGDSGAGIAEARSRLRAKQDMLTDLGRGTYLNEVIIPPLSPP
jgi:hypothetical protein